MKKQIRLKKKRYQKRMQPKPGFLFILLSVYLLSIQIVVYILSPDDITIPSTLSLASSYYSTSEEIILQEPVTTQEETALYESITTEEETKLQESTTTEEETTSQKTIATEEKTYSIVESETQSEADSTQINKTDLYWLSHVIMAEEEGACYENKLMCGLVVMNRVNDTKHFGNTIKDVIFEVNSKGEPQYACIKSQNGKTARIWLEPNEDSIKAATEILSGNCSISIPSNVVYQSERPLGSGLYKQIGNQFYSYK